MNIYSHFKEDWYPELVGLLGIFAENKLIIS